MRHAGKVTRIVFLARVPIIVWLLLVTFSLLGPASSFGRGLFDVEEDFGLMWVGLAAFLVTSGIVVSVNLIVEHGIDRSSSSPGLSQSYYRSPSRILFWIVQAPAVLLLVYAFRTTDRDAIVKSLEILGGALLAFLVVVAAQLGEFLLADPDRNVPNYLIYPFDRLRIVGPLLELAYRKNWGAGAWFRGRLDLLARRLATRHAGLFRGYLFQDQRDQPAFFPGQLFATTLAVISFAIWIVIGGLKEGRIGAPATWITVPSLAYVCLALVVLSWLFSALTFFFDRWRVPLLLIVLLWSLAVGRSTETDYYYRVSVDPHNQVKIPKPADVLNGKLHPVIIATAGGGIQAAAWTARVVTGIEETEARTGHSLLNNTALVSSVSGGSLGALYLGAYLSGKSHELNSAEAVNREVRESSLDDVAWGLVNPDLWRVFWPIVRDPVIDRGWALERSWEQRSDLQEVYLSDWAWQASLHKLPAFLFNSTAVETGSPVVFTNTDFPDHKDTWAWDTRHIRNILDLCGADCKVRVSTAARLSAAFPYVSPAARGYPCPAYHMVDGGYYDNYGVTTAVAWLREALHGMPSDATQLHDIAILIIRPDSDEDDKSGRIAGWNYQFGAPLDGIMSVRSDDQLRADLGLLSLVKDQLKQNGVASPLHVCPIDFAYPRKPPEGCNRQPMSWKLTGLQNACIDEAWKAGEKEAGSALATALDQIGSYLSSGKCPQQ